MELHALDLVNSLVSIFIKFLLFFQKKDKSIVFLFLFIEANNISLNEKRRQKYYSAEYLN